MYLHPGQWNLPIDFSFRKKEQSTLLAIIAKYSVSVGDWTTERAIGTSNAMKFVVFFEKCLK